MTHNVYVPKSRALKHMRPQIQEVQGEIGESTIIVGNFNTNQ